MHGSACGDTRYLGHSYATEFLREEELRKPRRTPCGPLPRPIGKADGPCLTLSLDSYPLQRKGMLTPEPCQRLRACCLC